MSKLDQLKAAFGKSDQSDSSSYGEQYPFWNMKDGEQAVIRFLPDKDENNPLGFLIEKLMHKLTINGQRRSVPCLKMYGEKDCPICSLSAEYYNNGDKINGKKYWRNKQHIARAVIVKDPLPEDENGETHEGKVRTITLSFQIYEAINQAFQSGELDEVPYDFENGCDFIIKKKVTKDGENEYATYVYSTFARRSTPLDQDGIELVELHTLLPDKVEYSELEKLLEADITGKSVDDSNDSSNKSNDSMEDQLAALKKKTDNSDNSKDENVDNKTEDSGDIEDEADAILASIMASRK